MLIYILANYQVIEELDNLKFVYTSGIKNYKAIERHFITIIGGGFNILPSIRRLLIIVAVNSNDLVRLLCEKIRLQKKKPAYGRHQLSPRPMRIVGPIQI